MDNTLSNIKIKVIAAVDRKGGLGYNGDLLFHVKEDLMRFKQLTWGDVVIMGYTTFLSLKMNEGLPYRVNVVLYNGSDFDQVSERYPMVIFKKDIDSALRCAFIDALANSTNSIWFIGGASIYQQVVKKYADMIELTVFDSVAENADVYFPMGDVLTNFKVIKEESVQLENNAFDITFLTLNRISSRAWRERRKEIRGKNN